MIYPISRVINISHDMDLRAVRVTCEMLIPDSARHVHLEADRESMSSFNEHSDGLWNVCTDDIKQEFHQLFDSPWVKVDGDWEKAVLSSGGETL